MCVEEKLRGPKDPFQQQRNELLLLSWGVGGVGMC